MHKLAEIQEHRDYLGDKDTTRTLKFDFAHNSTAR